MTSSAAPQPTGPCTNLPNGANAARIDIVGGGPGGLFAALLLQKDEPQRRVRVFERNRPDDTFGFGVVFSDATLEEVAEADPATFRAIRERFHHWDDIHVHYRGRRVESTGHGFAGLGRRELLRVLHGRCRDVGVELHFESEVADLARHRDADLIVGADGVNSAVRERFADAFEPTIDLRPNRYVWLGAARPFPAFTFYFREDEHGLWRVHAYQYDRSGRSTFIVEATERTWRRAGMDAASEEETVRFLSRLFAEELQGRPLISNRSAWRRFPTVANARWWLPGGCAGGGSAQAEGGRRARGLAGGAAVASGVHGLPPVVLIGDAAHTAHFSVGSGTRLAMLDGIALARALRRGDLSDALAAYEAERRRPVESLQRAAQASLQWFEDTERYLRLDPVQFAFSLLTRSLRISHENLRARDPVFVERIDRWVARTAERQSGVAVADHEERLKIDRAPSPRRSGASARLGSGPPPGAPPPPLFTPFRLRDMVLANRVGVSAMCQYSAEDGRIDDWHLVHLGSRAIGGAGLVVAEMTAVSREARISPGCAGLYTGDHAARWRRLVDFVHQRSHAKVGIQLGHAGPKASTRLFWEGPDEPLEEGAWPVVAASPVGYFDHSPVPAELDRTGMDAVLRDYERSTELAVEAGFDLLEVHMAHGYLLASFLSPLTNRRTDDCGGSLGCRMRYPLRVVRAVRALWPDERPLSVRLSAVDWWPGGNEPEDAVEIARALKREGCDVVDVSTGQTVPYQRPRYGRQYQTPFADRIRHEVGIATMAVGNISSFEDVNGIIAAGRADLCLMARAHLWDPYWTRHAAHALDYPLPWPDQYGVLERYTPRFGEAADAFGPQTGRETRR